MKAGMSQWCRPIHRPTCSDIYETLNNIGWRVMGCDLSRVI